MWSHYSDYHKGVVVGLTLPEVLVEGDRECPGEIVIIRDKYIHAVKYSKNELRLPLIQDRDHINNYLKICLQKSPQWKYEKEKRIIVVSSEVRKSGCRVVMSNKYITKVIFGARVSVAQIDETINEIGRKDIIYKRAIFNHGKFKLTLVPI